MLVAVGKKRRLSSVYIRRSTPTTTGGLSGGWQYLDFPATDLVNIGLNKFVSILDLDGTEVAERRVPLRPVVDAIEVFGHIGPYLVPHGYGSLLYWLP